MAQLRPAGAPPGTFGRRSALFSLWLVGACALGLVGACAADPGPEVASEARAVTVVAIPRGSLWRAWDRGGDLGSAWRGRFDDAGWTSGAGPLGYGESYLRTILGFGPSASSKYVTTYFRRSFSVDDPAAVTAITGEVMFDDGIVVYLNGTRIGRDSMPSGTVGAGTLALGHEANNAYTTYDWSAQRSLLVAGANVIAVEVHQVSPSSSDLVFDLALTLERRGVPEPLPQVVGGIGRGESWRYWDQGGDLGTAWRVGTYTDGRYDDSSWPSGPGPLGYGETYQRTTLGFGPDAAHKLVTAYFRAQVWVSDPDQVQSMLGDLMYDDGLVVYLNGTEIARRSMPAGAVTAATLALDHEAENRYERIDWNAYRGLLVTGYNIVAVEVHQASRASSDLTFDLALLLTSVGPSPPPSAPEDIARRSTWRYFDRGAQPGRYGSWREPESYSDADWASGAGPLGYGESYIATPVSYGPSAAAKYITTYFRKWFTVAHPSAQTTMLAELMYDDGVVVYLNGHEISRLHMPSGSVDDTTLAEGHETGNAYERLDWSAFDQYLVAGPNLLAVEVHQTSPGSSDLTFDLALAVDTPAVAAIPGCGPAVPPLPDAPLSDVWVGPSTVWAVGDGGAIGRRALADGPWQWCVRDAAARLHSVWGSGDNDVWIVGDAGRVTHYDGTSFAEVDLGTTSVLNRVWGSGADDIFVVGGGGTVRWFDGTSWSAADLAPDQNLATVWGASADDVWVGGAEPAPYPGDHNYDGYTAIIYRWLPASSSWSRDASYTMFYGAAIFGGIHGSGANDVWAVGPFYPAGAADSFNQAVHYDGTAWAQIPLSDEVNQGLSYDDVLDLGSEVWITGGAIVHDDGTSWTLDDRSAAMIAIDGRPGEIWSAGWPSRILRRSGATWVRDW